MLPQSTIPPSGVAVGSITGSPTIVGCLILLHSIMLNHMTEYKRVVKLFQRFNHEWLLAKPESLRYSQITNIYTRLWIIQGNFMNKYLCSKLCLTYCSFFCQEMLACCSLAGSNKKNGMWSKILHGSRTNWFLHHLPTPMSTINFHSPGCLYLVYWFLTICWKCKIVDRVNVRQ